jgi:hypothetical protein
MEQQILRMMDERIKDGKEYLQHKLTFDAFVRAVRSLTTEIAAREGISAELCLARFQALSRWHLDDILRTASDIHPNLMGELDGRNQDDIPTDDSPPLVFAPPPEAASQ